MRSTDARQRGLATARAARRKVYNVVKVPPRAVRDRYYYETAKRHFPRALEASEFEWSDLDRFAEYFEYAFRQKKPNHPIPLQRPTRYFPGLRAMPVWNPDEFEFLGRLRADRAEIAAEFESYQKRVELEIHHQRLNGVGTWNVLYLHAAGTPNLDVHPFFSTSLEAIAPVPGMGVVGQAYFSLLSPDTHIPAHCGPTNTKIRVQLRLDVPSGSVMRIGDHMHDWDNGDDILVFDDSFEHEVWVRGTSQRSVLIFDFWHPDLSPAERWALQVLEEWTPDRRRYRRRSKTVQQNAGTPA